MRFRPALDTDAEAWQALLAGEPSGDFLHDWAWAAVAAFDGQPQRRFVLEDGGRIVAIVAAQVRAVRGGGTFWYVPHGPVLAYGDPSAPDRLRALVIGLREVARGARAIAVKVEPRLPRGSAAADLLAWAGLRPVPGTLQVGQTRIVPLGSDEDLLAGFDKDTRYSVRRAEREGVTVDTVDDPDDLAAIDTLHGLVGETQRRAGFAMPPLARYRIAWRSLAAVGRARILQATHGKELLASALLVLEGDRSFYLFSGSKREEPGAPKRFASYALQWEMMRLARELGSRQHDLWGVAPPGASKHHPWAGVGLFKKGFGGEEVIWAGSWDLVVDPTMYRLREAAGIARGWLGRLRRRLRR